MAAVFEPGRGGGSTPTSFEARYALLPFANIARGALRVDFDNEGGETVPVPRPLGTSSAAVTAPDLAHQLGVDPRRLRSWLRNQGWRSPAEHGSPWLLDEHQARAARPHFGHR